jgi:hypothetical protein
MAMKKYFVTILAAFMFFTFGCEKVTDPGGTALEKMAGDWWVQNEVVDLTTGASYEEYDNYGDAYGVGNFLIYTFNTAANTNDEMWINDDGNFWDFQVKAAVDYANMTFTSHPTDTISVVPGYDISVKIYEGKILQGAATTPSGMPADSIFFIAEFEDDPGFGYVFKGFRRTGFAADDF